MAMDSIGLDVEVPLALSPSSVTCVIGLAAAARAPGKGIAFHAGDQDVRAQHLMRQAVSAHQFGDRAQHGIVAVSPA